MRDAPGALCLYGRYVAISIRSQMQYRASFAMLAAGHFLSTGIEFLGVLVLFDRFGSLQGWGLPEVALFYGMVNVSFAVAEGVGRGFDTFARLVRGGDFDRLLLRPRGTALQVAGQEIDLLRIGRFSQGLFVLVWASMALGVEWNGARIGLLLLAVLGGACFFVGLFVLQATMCFWTTESLEIVNTVTYGGVEAGQFPLSVYRDWLQRLFTFIVPLGLVTYFPAIAILGREDPLGTTRGFQYAAPLIGVAFLCLALRVWRFGERHYRSTGS
ncbi:MAG: ABC-2 family transporter protein [Chloroflexi bacterium]|nr:ABC-2 family transporter protein [Chloroflexota bacterium]